MEITFLSARKGAEKAEKVPEGLNFERLLFFLKTNRLS
jgi:hypothetical protein